MANFAPNFRSSILAASVLALCFSASAALAGPDKMPDVDETPPPAIEMQLPENPVESSDGAVMDITPEIQPTQTQPAQSQPAMESTPTEIMTVPTPSGFQCHEQEDGRTECICATETECTALEAANVCVPGTNWTHEAYGGCTKKQPQASDAPTGIISDETES